ncbi:UNVERIFIED_CONTAM: hypothetical protein GTU68_018846 [Idotea baltica]|nr:hypothetical protein [Idotea baltica]
MTLLNVEGLRVSFTTADGQVNAVNDVSFAIDAGETLAIVGESGSGKSQTAFAIMGLLARNGRASGQVLLDGQNLLEMSVSQLNKVRSKQIGMIFQDPMTSLNPYMKISDQLTEVLMLHDGLSKGEALKASIQMLDAVQIPDAKGRINLYPHEFSGGMRQRVMIAMALLCKPRLLIADEPTTALDVTVQAQIMELLADIQRDLNTAVILITHDLGIVAGACEKTMVMYGGQIMEAAPTETLFAGPTHPYTQGLLNAVPRLDRDDEQLLSIEGDPPDMSKLPAGCPFSPRCAQVRQECHDTKPALTSFAQTRSRACHLTLEEVQ